MLRTMVSMYKKGGSPPYRASSRVDAEGTGEIG